MAKSVFLCTLFMDLYTFMYSQVFIECFSCARPDSRNWEYRSDQTTPNPFSHGTGTLVVSVWEREDPGLGVDGLQCKIGGQGSPSWESGNQVARQEVREWATMSCHLLEEHFRQIEHNHRNSSHIIFTWAISFLLESLSRTSAQWWLRSAQKRNGSTERNLSPEPLRHCLL